MERRAISELVNLPELLVVLGQQIHSRQLLYHLCLVSKAFHSSFVPFLYSKVIWDDQNTSALLNKARHIEINPYWRYTKSFSYQTSNEFSYSVNRTSTQEDILISLNHATELLLAHSPQLLHFSWHAGTRDVICTSVLRTLQSQCPKLRSLVVKYPKDIDELLDEDEEWNTWNYGGMGGIALTEILVLFRSPNLALFTGLTRLEVCEIYGDLVRQGSDIVSVLLSSPQLNALSLSLNRQSAYRFNHEHNDDFCLHFFRNLCHEYQTRAQKSNRSPLSLRKLSLGYSVCLYQPQFWPQLTKERDQHEPTGLKGPALYLRDLTNLEFLEEVYMDNDGRNVGWIRRNHIKFAWDTFTRGVCPNLRRLSIEMLDSEATRWLVEDLKPGYLSELMIHDDLENNLLRTIKSFKDFGTGSSLEGRRKTEIDLPSQNPTPLTMLAVDICENPLSLWLGLHSCTALEKLRLEGDIMAQNIICATVAKLKNLSQLHISCPKPDGLDPWQASLAFTEELAKVGQRLQYIKISESEEWETHAWRVRRDGSGVAILEELDKWDTQDIELFNIF